MALSVCGNHRPSSCERSVVSGVVSRVRFPLLPQAFVAETPEEAEEFLEDCMAVVCKNLREVKEYFEEAGTDIAGMSDDAKS